MLNWKSRSSHDCLRSFSVPKVISHSQSTVYIELNLRLKNQFQKINDQKQSEVLTLIECEHNDGKIKTALSYLVISPAIFGSPKIFPPACSFMIVVLEQAFCLICQRQRRVL